MPACHPKPADPKKYISDIGRELVRSHGKKKNYSPREVRSAADRLGYPDFSCWGMSFYCSPSDFKAHHEATGEACDYAEMKTELLHDLGSTATDSSLFNLDFSWLELPSLNLPDLDFSSIFDWLDFS